MASTPGFEPGRHWWEASALAIAPPLLPKCMYHLQSFKQITVIKVSKANHLCIVTKISFIYSSFHLVPLSNGLAIIMHFDVHAHVHMYDSVIPLAGFKHFNHAHT